MSERELNRAVAQATGETVAEISRRGFQPLEEELEDYRIDWDAALAARLSTPFPKRRPRPAVA